MKNILVFNVNWVGDVIFSTPVFKALKKNYPQAKITCLAVPSVHPVLEMNPDVDEILTYDEKGKHSTPWGKLGLILELRKKKFAVAFLLHRSWTRACLVFLSGIPERVGFNEKKRGVFLTHKIHPPLCWRHRADHYLAVIESYGVEAADRDYDLSVSEQDKNNIQKQLESEGIGENDPFVVVNPGGNWDLKRWPKEHFAELIRGLSEEQGARVVLSGAPKDAEFVKGIARLSGVNPVVFAGKTSLKELAALMKRAKIVVSSDTGPLHLAASVGTDVIGLFGPTRPEVTGPRGKGNMLILLHDVECNGEPCYNLQCPDNICMQAVSVKEILNEVRAMTDPALAGGLKERLDASKSLSRKPLGKSFVKRILVVSLTNIGDVILTFPVLDVLKRDFPDASLSVVVGPKNESLFQGNPYIKKAYIFDKQASGSQKVAWVSDLRKEKFDLIVDLRNTALPFIIPTKHRTLPSRKTQVSHMKYKHLNRLKSVSYFIEESSKKYSVYVRDFDNNYVDNLLRGSVNDGERFVVVSPGAADRLKRWTEEGFARVCDKLVDLYGVKIVMVGDEKDYNVAQRILVRMTHNILNICGRTSLVQLAEVLKRSSFAIVNDSGVMHMASYMDVPTVAIFGPTDPNLYGPWSSQHAVIRRNKECKVCQDPSSSALHTCMTIISPEDILSTIHFSNNRFEISNT